jgi:hypothetical protein
MKENNKKDVADDEVQKVFYPYKNFIFYISNFLRNMKKKLHWMMRRRIITVGMASEQTLSHRFLPHN